MREIAQETLRVAECRVKKDWKRAGVIHKAVMLVWNVEGTVASFPRRRIHQIEKPHLRVQEEMKVASIQNDQIQAAVHPVKRTKAGFHDLLEWTGAADETDEGVLDRCGSAWSPSHKFMQIDTPTTSSGSSRDGSSSDSSSHGWSPFSTLSRIGTHAMSEAKFLALARFWAD